MEPFGCAAAEHEQHHSADAASHLHEWGRHAGDPPPGETAAPQYPMPDKEQWQKWEAHREEHDREHVKEQRVSRWKGIALTYIAWAIMAWMVFVYGRLIYNLLGTRSTRLADRDLSTVQLLVAGFGFAAFCCAGPGEEISFVRAWLIALGIDNATDFKEVVQQALKTVLIFVLLEPFIIPRETWCEPQAHTRGESVGPIDMWVRRGNMRANADARPRRLLPAIQV